MVTEGTYPIHPGGVSIWCDQLIRGLDEHQFEIVALTGTGTEQIACELPMNVTKIRKVALWGHTGQPWWLSGTVRRRFVVAFRTLLEALLGDGPDAPAAFEAALRQLHPLARNGQLTWAMRSQSTVEVFRDIWFSLARGRRGFAHDEITLEDLFTMIDLVEHHLRPLAMQPLQVDCVHAVANGPCVLAGLTSKWADGTPLIMSEHGVYLRERILAMRAAGYSRPVKAFMIRFFIRLSELGYRIADAIVPVNQFNQRWERRNGAPAASIQTIYNGVDPARFPLAEQEPDVPTLSFVGRIDPLKNIEDLIRSFALVREQVPDARLRLFGPVTATNTEYAQRCVRLVSELDLGQCATFEGPIVPVSLGYRAGHVVVLSSISEGLPYSVIEAMASGRTTVSTDVGGVAEAVGETGLVVPSRQPHAFAHACVRLLTDHELRHGLAAAAHHRARTMFDIDQLVGSFRELYGQLVGDREGPFNAGHRSERQTQSPLELETV